MINGVLHCGYCGQPARDCGGQCDERQALMRAVCDSLALMNVPPPIQTPLPPRVKFGDYYICSSCQMAAEYCACAKQRPPDVAATDGVESSLEARARRCMGGK